MFSFESLTLYFEHGIWSNDNKWIRKAYYFCFKIVREYSFWHIFYQFNMMNDIWRILSLSLSQQLTRYCQGIKFRQWRRYREDAKGRWWDSRENLQVWSVEQVTEAETCIEREYYIDQGLTMRYKEWEGGGGEAESGKQGWCRLLSRRTPEPRSPLRAGPVTPVLFHVARARKCMKTSTHSPSPTSAKLHDLRVLSVPKLFPANRKNSPSTPASPLALHPRKTPSVFCIVTFSRLTRCAAHCFNRIASILNRH